MNMGVDCGKPHPQRYCICLACKADRFPNLAKHVECVRERIGSAPTYVLKLDTPAQAARNCFIEAQQLHPFKAMNHVGREISIWGCE